MLPRDDFATAVLIQLAEAGETGAVYDAASFSILRQPTSPGGSGPTGHCALSRWYEMFQEAEPQGRGDEVIADFVEQWQAVPDEVARPINKARLVPLVRSRFDYEANALRVALQAKDHDNPRGLMRLFSFPPLAEHLVTVLSEDQPEGYRQLSRLDLEPLGMTEDAALRLALFNLSQIDPRFNAPQPFVQRDAGYWVTAGEPSDLAASWLLLPDRVRTIPVRGRHVAFIPKVSLLAITGADEVEVLKRLIAKTFQALRTQPGRSISAFPFVLEPDGWKPWLPPVSHPAYWQIKELHVAQWADLYETQKELLDKLNESRGGNPPMVASFSVTEFDGDHGETLIASHCVWTQWLDTLLPKTDAVILNQFLNAEELEQNPDAEPKFGEQITLAWQDLLDYLGDRLQADEFYPTRYHVAGDQFPTGDDWERLKAKEATLPLEDPVPGGSTEASSTSESASESSHTLRTATPLAGPLPPPPEPKAPPEPSWWPVMGCGLVVALSLACCVGAVLGGVSWLQNKVAAMADRQRENQEEVQQQRARPFDPQPPADEPMGPIEPLEPQQLNVEQVQADIQNAIRQFERQMAAAVPPAAVPPTEPMEPALPALLELGTPEQELPLLSFVPTDLSAVGPEIQGDMVFQDVAPPGGWLVGFRAIKGESWGGSIVALQPIYQVGNEYHLGQQCGGGVGGFDQQQLLAKPGYAVSSIEARFGLIMNAFRLKFQRVENGRLDPADTYASDWFGGDGGGSQELSGGGMPLVGIAGSYQAQEEVITIQALKATIR